eukprot:jgi/Astpho2/9381/Aster-01650
MAKGKAKKGADADEGAADKKLKPANFVKVRHILCEKQSKVRRRRWSVRLYAQLPLASGMCSGALFPSPAVSKVLDIPLQILEAQERIRNGEQFATVASGMSEDKARQGGDLGWKGRQDVVGAFAEAAFKLDVGEMTAAPVKTHFGHHLILCEGRKQKL